MKEYAVLTGVGPDRPGLVEEVAAALAERDLNLEESRMAVLGGEFALIVLASGAEAALADLRRSLGQLGRGTGLEFALKPTRSPAERPAAPALPYRLLAQSLDHPGIVHEITRVLHSQNVNIESLETHVRPAPISGTPVFALEARLSVPAESKAARLRAELLEVADQFNLDLVFEPA
jgi:glycine cleavage system transcriptional repressor